MSVLLALLLACAPSSALDADPSPDDTETPNTGTEPPDEGDDATDDEDDDLLERLAALTDDLWYYSEGDSTVEIVFLEGAGDPFPTVDTALTVLSEVHEDRPDETPFADRLLVQWALEDFFERLVEEESWWDDEMRADAVRWAALQAVFADELVDGTVFRVGEWDTGNDVGGAVDVYVVAATADGDLVGFHVISVET